MIWRALYAGLSRSIRPLSTWVLSKRVRAGKEDPARLDERKGQSRRERPKGQLIWMHGASVGETTMLLPLIKTMLNADPELHILVTSGTVTSAKIMGKRLPARAFHQYLPLDVPAYVSRFLDHWQPDLAVWAESDIWPNLIRQTHKSGAKLALINARMSEKSLNRWQKRQRFARQIFGCFDRVLPADQLTYQGLSALTPNIIPPLGNLKSAMPPPDYDKAEAERLRAAIGKRPIWLAASTHPPEESAVLTAHETVQKTRPDALLIWIPRHPERGSAITELCKKHSLARRTVGEHPQPQSSIYLMDTLGEMGLGLALSDMVFIGGSLDPSLTGHNPLEAARLGVSILTGPYVASFTEIYKEFNSAQAVLRVDNPTMLATTLTDLWENPTKSAALSRNAAAVAQTGDAVLTQTAQALRRLLEEAHLDEVHCDEAHCDEDQP